jgi:hypothetical protein
MQANAPTVVKTQQGLREYWKDTLSLSCQQYGGKYRSAESLRQHRTSIVHDVPKRDHQQFRSSRRALRQHLRSAVNVSHFHCCGCDRDFVDQHAPEQHLINKVHYVQQPKAAIKRQPVSAFYCSKYMRTLKTNAAFHQHLGSAVHKPFSDIKCLTSRRYKVRFISPPALLYHLESGACRSGLTRAKIEELIIKHDTSRLISRSYSNSRRAMESKSRVGRSPGTAYPR